MTRTTVIETQVKQNEIVLLKFELTQDYHQPKVNAYRLSNNRTQYSKFRWKLQSCQIPQEKTYEPGQNIIRDRYNILGDGHNTLGGGHFDIMQFFSSVEHSQSENVT